MERDDSSNGPVMYASGTCYDDAFAIMFEIMRDFSDWKRQWLRIAHGILDDNDRDNMPFSHAWVEWKDMALVKVHPGSPDHPPFIAAMPLEEYLAKFGPYDITRYDATAVMLLSKTYGTTGPWEPRYLALCNRE